MDSPEGISVRPVKLKVLYTFDAEHKNNHLARCPQSLEVQTAFVDDTNQIGVIDLKTCLEAVTEASPELISNLENDFTIYAYDYSETDHPLVGQGLLSRRLGLQDGDVDNDTENVVTGRITKNVMGLFAKSAQETLEVKLRFNPVLAPSDFRRPRQGSMIGQGSGQQVWSASNQGPSALALPTQSLPQSTSPMDTSGLEIVQKMLSEGGPQRERSGSYFGSDSTHPRASSRPPSRPGTPTLSQAFNPPMRQSTGPISRPSSRAGMRQPSHARRDSFNSGYYSGEETIEEGPARKRARITSVNFPSRSDLNIERQPDSLRVAASTASSVRIHRPVPINPALSLDTSASTEEPARPPTPVPTKTGRPRGRPRKHASSNLRSQPRPSSPMVEPANRQSQLPEVSFSSPEDNRPGSASSTPANIPSSPPVMHTTAPLPSSPRLPPLPGDNDSGFMSSNFDDIFGDGSMIQFDDFLTDRPDEVQDAQNLEQQEPTPAAENYAPVFDETNDVDESMSPVQQQAKNPSNSIETAHAPQPLIRSQSLAPHSAYAISSPKLAPAPMPRARQIEEERRAITLSQIPASDPIGRSLHRSNTWAGDMSDMPMSEANMGEEPKRRVSKKRVGKEQTRARLEAAIASGELPPYCDNCGAIETPAWRRAYRRDFMCSWDEIETSLDDGACNFKEPTEYNKDGTIKAFKGYKTAKSPEDNDSEWVAISLCNPCGLWFHKQKCMRPPEKWSKKDPMEKRKRRSRKKSTRVAAKKAEGTGNGKSDAVTPDSDGSSPADTATEAADADDHDHDQNDEAVADSNEPELPPMPRMIRANSAEPARRPRFGIGLAQHLRPGLRATLSSPGRAHGSETQPIEIDLTPKLVRRQLFPSPDKTQKSEVLPAKTAEPPYNLPAIVRRSPRLNKTLAVVTPLIESSLSHVVSQGKDDDTLKGLDALDDLFNDDGHPLAPSTPTPKRRSERIIFRTPSKTPQRNFGDALSPNIQRLPGLPTPKMLSGGRHPIAEALLGSSKTPKNMTPFTRSIHEALADVSSHYARTSPTAISGEPFQTPKKPTPGKGPFFDFPDLPSLNGSSPVSSNPLMQFDFSELTTDHLTTDFNDVFSTDAPVPSSPPAGFFNFINTHDDGTAGAWDDILGGFGGDMGVRGRADAYAEPGPSQILRRSPRKKA